MAISYDKASTDLEALLAKDADAEVKKLAAELINESQKPEVKGAACLAIAKLRLKSEMMLHGFESQVFAPVNEALKLFREADEKHGEASALNTLAQAYLIESQIGTAISTAKEANRLATGFRDKSVAASIQKTMCQIYVAQGDPSKAMLAAKEHVSVLETIDSQDETMLRVLVDALATLADMQLQRGMKDASRLSAEKMAKIAAKLGDKEKALADKSLSAVLVKAGKEDEAPNRLKATAALQRAMAACERKSAEDFKKWWYEVESLGGVTHRDIQQSLDRIREHSGSEGLDEFLRAVGAPFATESSPCKINQFTKRYMYIGMRAGGIQYGPRYQCVSPYRAGEAATGKALAHLRPSSESDAWEQMMGFHTGILDGSLQSGSVLSAPLY